ncbi:hypothetical protein A6P39_028270 [Streptomyces sp. FXJ1.172]|nr:hypothetical protein [Streptomyces sp. FXJ1.172]WEO97595.1 hypothetical protein A6P39_028270 [Streptomyces sp. FXJ1.172]
MANAHPEVPAVAGLVLPENEREGVARLLSGIRAALPGQKSDTGSAA